MNNPAIDFVPGIGEVRDIAHLIRGTGNEWEPMPVKPMTKSAADATRIDLLFEALKQLHQFVGKPVSGYGKIFVVNLAVSFVAYIAGSVASGFVINAFTKPGEGMFVFGFVFGIPLFFAALAFGMLAFPREFFEFETMGKRLVVLSGAKSAATVKPMSIGVGIGFILITVGMVAFMISRLGA